MVLFHSLVICGLPPVCKSLITLKMDQVTTDVVKLLFLLVYMCYLKAFYLIMPDSANLDHCGGEFLHTEKGMSLCFLK